MHQNSGKVITTALQNLACLAKQAPGHSDLRFFDKGLITKLASEECNVDDFEGYFQESFDTKFSIPNVFVYIPLVRHFPNQEIHSYNPFLLTLHDNLDDQNAERKCEVLYNIVKPPIIMGSNPTKRTNPLTLRLRDWSSGVILQNTYYSHKSPRHFLYSVNNGRLGKRAWNDLPNFANELIPTGFVRSPQAQYGF